MTFTLPVALLLFDLRLLLHLLLLHVTRYVTFVTLRLRCYVTRCPRYVIITLLFTICVYVTLRTFIPVVTLLLLLLRFTRCTLRCCFVVVTLLLCCCCVLGVTLLLRCVDLLGVVTFC